MNKVHQGLFSTIRMTKVPMIFEQKTVILVIVLSSRIVTEHHHNGIKSIQEEHSYFYAYIVYILADSGFSLDF